MLIAVDLRGLNYMQDSGVNIYTFYLLYQLWTLKHECVTKFKVIGIGLEKQNQQVRGAQYEFFDQLFDEHICFGEYLGLSFLNNKSATSICLLFNFLGINKFPSIGFLQNKIQPDFLLCPQPKPIFTHSKTKLVVVFHDLYASFDARMQGFRSYFLNHPSILKTIAQNSYQVWANSISTSSQIEQKLGVNKIKIKLVYPSLPNMRLKPNAKPSNFFDSDILDKSFQNQEFPNSNYILTISTAEPRKNWHNLILAHKYLQNTKPDWNTTLVFAGYGFESRYFLKIKEMVAKMEIKNVVFLGKVGDEQKQQLLQKCLFLAYPSLWEGFGFPILEAFGVGKPVLVSNIGSSPEVAGPAGLYVNPLNHQDIASGLYILTKDNKLRKQKEFLTQAELAKFSWNETKNALKQLLI